MKFLYQRQLSLRSLLIVFLISISSLTEAQIIPKDILERVNNSQYIFEGKVICSNSYFTQDHRNIYTSNTVEIYKVFKGNLTCGEVEIITNCGTVNDTSCYLDHGLVLRRGMEGIFLCNETQKELPPDEFCPESNSVKLDVPYETQGFIKIFKDEVNKVINDWQFSLDSLVQAYDLFELYTQLNYIDCAPAPIVNPTVDQFRKAVQIVNTTSAVDTVLSYTLMNQQITGTSPKYFEFDIAFSDNQDFVYFIIAGPKLEYDTLTFGPEIDQNGKLMLTNTTLLSDPSTYEPVYASDIARNRVHITTDYVVPSAGVNYVDVPWIPTPAIHVKIEIFDCTHTSQLTQITTPPVYIAQYSLSNNSGPLIKYDTISLSNDMPFNGACYLQIDSVVPYMVNAGTDDTVVVYGRGFKNTQGTGSIYLRNADYGLQNYYIKLDTFDIEVWSDTLVRFVVPGIVDSIDVNTNAEYGVPGSGFLKLTNNQGDSVQGDWLGIFYAIVTEIVLDNGIYMKKNNIPLDLTLNQQGGVKFSFDTSFVNYPDRMECAHKAIKDWVCLTNIHFEAGDSLITAGNPPPTPIAGRDQINMITFGPTGAGNLAETTIWSFPSPGCPHEYFSQVDLIVNELYKDSLFADTARCDTVPHMMYDLYSLLLHELGHAHGIDHINDSAEVMYFASERGANPYTPASERHIWLDYDASSDSAGEYIMNNAADPVAQTCLPGSHLITPIHLTDCGRGRRALNAADCSPSDVQEISEDGYTVTFYPNPVSSLINFKFDEEKPEDVIIQVHDLTGRVAGVESKFRTVRGENNLTLPVSSLISGMYFVVIKSRTKYSSFRFSKI